MSSWSQCPSSLRRSYVLTFMRLTGQDVPGARLNIFTMQSSILGVLDAVIAPSEKTSGVAKDRAQPIASVVSWDS